jgi:hypothetical protein
MPDPVSQLLSMVIRLRSNAALAPRHPPAFIPIPPGVDRSYASACLPATGRE